MLRHSLCHRKRPRIPASSPSFANALSAELAGRVRNNALSIHTSPRYPSWSPSISYRISKCRLRAYSSSKKKKEKANTVLPKDQRQVEIKVARQGSIWTRFASLLDPAIHAPRESAEPSPSPSKVPEPSDATDAVMESIKAKLEAQRAELEAKEAATRAKKKVRKAILLPRKKRAEERAERKAAAQKAKVEADEPARKASLEAAVRAPRRNAMAKRAALMGPAIENAVPARKKTKAKSRPAPLSSSKSDAEEPPSSTSASEEIATQPKPDEAKESEPPHPSQRPRTRRRAVRSKPSSLVTLARKRPEEKFDKVIFANDLRIEALDLDRSAVPRLEYGLDRVLFNSGIYQLQDARTRVYNFDPYLKNIMPLVEFDFDTIKEYKTSSRDSVLRDIAETHRKKYVGSTSSMTGTLSQFHFLLSNWRRINHRALSRGFRTVVNDFTRIARAPNAIFLRYNPDTKTYAIDADKEYDTPNVLMMLGKSMELLLTKSTTEFERHKKGHQRPITEEERNEPETYQYTTMGDFLMRSQLDAHDPRLPGTGMFDLKTRAVLTVRMNSKDYESMTGYQLDTLRGPLSSYEKEIYDMTRSTMLKYLLQVRMGRMDGIFVAYHNVEQMFGFQYLPVSELDSVIHGTSESTLGDAEFKFSLRLLNEVLEKATKKFPEQSLRLHFETQTELYTSAYMVFYAEPVQESEIERIQSLQQDKIAEFERKITGAASEQPAAADTTPEASTLSEDSPPSSEASSLLPDAPTSSSESSSSSELESGPLLMGSINVANAIKRPHDTVWKRCESNRPYGLLSDANWRMQYILREVEADDATKWKHYNAVKRKRRTLFTKHVKDEEKEAESPSDGASSGGEKPKKENPYIAFLRALSEKGKLMRKEMETLEMGKDKIVVGWPPMEAAIAGERIQSVDDYMNWIYPAETARQTQQPPKPDDISKSARNGSSRDDPGSDDFDSSIPLPRLRRRQFSYLDDHVQVKKPARTATRAPSTGEQKHPPPSTDDYLKFVYDPAHRTVPEKADKEDSLSSDTLDLLEEAGERQTILSVDDYMSLLHNSTRHGRLSLRGK